MYQGAYQGAYKQFSLANLPPSGIEPTKTVVFDVTLGVVEDRVSLTFEERGTSGQDYLAIREDTIVEIVLNGDQLYFSKDYDAITTKEDLVFYYGGVEYDDYDETLNRYNKVRFIARFNKGGKYGTVHPFNLNVDLLQSAPGEEPCFVKLTIDPDIKNPPPHV